MKENEQKEILDQLPKDKLKKVSTMSAMQRATRIYNLLPINLKQEMLRVAVNPNITNKAEANMKIINSIKDEKLKERIKEIAGDLLDE